MDFETIVRLNGIVVFYYFLPANLLITKIITATITTTKNAPTPIPALNMPSTTEQLETNNSTNENIRILAIFSFIIFYF